MAEINGVSRYFGYRKLESNGKCCVCQKPLIKGSKVIRVNVGRSYGSICHECLEIMSNVANGHNYGLNDSDFDRC